MSTLGTIIVDGDAPTQNTIINAIIRQGRRHQIHKFKGISYGFKGLCMDGFDSVSEIQKDISTRPPEMGNFQSVLQTKRYEIAPIGADEKLLKENAKRIAKTWEALKIDDLVLIGGVGGIISFREVSKYLPNKYRNNWVAILKTMNGDGGRLDKQLSGALQEQQSPILSSGQATAATVAKYEIRRAMTGCYNGCKILVAQFLGDFCGWNVAAAQEGGALVILPEMYRHRSVEEMNELIAMRIKQDYNDQRAVIAAVSESTPTDEEERKDLLKTYDKGDKRTTGKRPKNKADMFSQIISRKLKEGNFSEKSVAKMDITYQGRWYFPTELDVRIAWLYSTAAVRALKDSKREYPIMPFLETDKLLKKDPQAMGADLTIEDIGLAPLDQVVLQPVPERYLTRRDDRTLEAGDLLERLLGHIAYSEKYERANELLMGVPPLG